MIWRAVWAVVLCSGIPAQAAPDGAALFAQHCAACHQADGQGTVGLAPALKGPHWQRLGADRVYLPQVLVHGLSGLIVVNGERHVGSMPAFATQLDDESLAAVANHLQRVVQGRQEPDYTAGDMRAVRDAGGSPPKSRERRVQALK
jgi:mono/diheme cytochrome c family protein